MICCDACDYNKVVQCKEISLLTHQDVILSVYIYNSFQNRLSIFDCLQAVTSEDGRTENNCSNKGEPAMPTPVHHVVATCQNVCKLSSHDVLKASCDLKLLIAT